MDLPMPDPATNKRPLKYYQVLSFDVYGTLIEYKSHILFSFTPLLTRLPPTSTYLNSTPLSTTIPHCATVGQIEFLKLFQKQEDTIKLEKPIFRFDAILEEIWLRIARELGVDTTSDEAAAFGSKANIASWPVFPGTMEALKRLSKRFKLVAVSNIDYFAWTVTASSPVSPLGDVDWMKVFTTEDFGDFDPKQADETKLNAVTEFCAANGVHRERILHVAQSLGHDHAPAKRLGIASVFLIGDGPKWGKEAESKMVLEKGVVGYGWRCRDMSEFADVVERDYDRSL